MYIPRHFEETRVDVLHQLIRDEPFGALVTLGGNGLEANHLPFELDAAAGPFGTLRGHVSRANAVWRDSNPAVEALTIFQGPQRYVTPSWYPTKAETGKVVPTWNYVVVHAYGPIRFIDDPAGERRARGLRRRAGARHRRLRAAVDAARRQVEGQSEPGRGGSGRGHDRPARRRGSGVGGDGRSHRAAGLARCSAAAGRQAMFTLDKVVPWGRSFDEYQQLFALTPGDLERRMLGCGDGPAAFNAEATRRGARVVSSDPLYAFSRDDIEARLAATCDTVLEQTRRHADQFVWGHGIASIDELGGVRMRAMRVFLEDYDAGRAAGRYVDSRLPTLPFADGSFDLALCSHLLFLYSAQFDEAFHRASIREMCRVAPEVRIFPLLALDGSRSPFVEACVAEARTAGAEAETVTSKSPIGRSNCWRSPA